MVITPRVSQVLNVYSSAKVDLTLSTLWIPSFIYGHVALFTSPLVIIYTGEKKEGILVSHHNVRLVVVKMDCEGPLIKYRKNNAR